MSKNPWPYGQATREHIRSNLAAYSRRAVAAEGLRPAAVSVVLAPSVLESGADGATAFLLTLRAPRLNAHAGQYALPGGKLDPGEDALTAARRELHEELGIEADPEQVLGVLDDLPTRSGYLVTPFVVWLGQAAEPRPAPDEIAELHRIPLTDLFAGRGRGANRDLSARDTSGAAVFSLYLPALGHDLFAPTAAIMEHFREVALEGRPTPVVRFGEPPFARR
ncbi:MAG: CoA pyrophosphatase [Proteobacteria bacterium]|nr:CoA pyrophosphatase [Pseudomonadota bacterium]